MRKENFDGAFHHCQMPTIGFFLRNAFQSVSNISISFYANVRICAKCAKENRHMRKYFCKIKTQKYKI